MNLSDMPTRVAIPFANDAGSGYIRPVPVPSQIGVTAGAASFTDGFTPDTFTPLGGGGAYVSGEDMNGILNHVTKWSRWQSAGGAALYNSAFATALGGYPQDAVLASTAGGGKLWQNQVDGNLTDPDGGGAAGWAQVGPAPATLAEAVTGVDLASFISPGILAGMATGIDGESILLPGGWILKVGHATNWGGGNSTAHALSFATPFPTTLMGVYATADGQANGSWSPIAVMLPGFTRFGGTVIMDSTDAGHGIDYARGVYWAALGK